MDWIDPVQDRGRWRAVVNAVMASIESGEFLEWLRTCWLLRKDSAPCSL
jgi:hypothetical protein